MASKLAKQFRQRLEENRGKSMDGNKLFGRTELLTSKVVEVWDDEKLIHVDINSSTVSDRDKVDLQYQCKSLLPYIDEYKEGEKICLSQVCNTIFDIQVNIKQLANGKQVFKCATL